MVKRTSLICVLVSATDAHDSPPALPTFISPVIARPIPADGRPMPAAEQPAAMVTHVIPMVDRPVFLPMMGSYAMLMSDSGCHKQQCAQYPRDDANSV